MKEMKKEGGFAEVIALLCLIVMFIIVFGIKNVIESKRIVYSQYNIGDSMYMNGLNITGKINKITSCDPIRMNLLVVGTNGMPAIIENIDIRNLTKIQSVEK